MGDDKIERKLAQAEFHLDALRAATDDLAIESYFSAFLACIRSATMYAHEWQIDNGRATRKSDWAAINNWERGLDPADYELWRAAIDLRNTDIHEDPVIPFETWGGGMFGGFWGSFFGNFWGDRAIQTVNNPETGNAHSIVEIANCAIRVARQLLAEYKSI